MTRNARSNESGEFGENLSKGLIKANELARRAPSKATNVAKAANLAKMASLAKNLPKGLRKAKELARRAPSKAAN